MHRLLVETAALSADAPALPKEALRHLRVVRPKNGEHVELFDGRGAWRVYRYDAASGGLRADGAPNVATRPDGELILFACVTKGSRWDWTIEKATELGVTRLVPVISDRTIVRIAAGEAAAKRERWLRIAEDAARQSDAKWLPEIVAPVPFAESLALVSKTDCLVGALTTPPPPTVGEVLVRAERRYDAVYVGPEGDFTPAELSALLAVATPVSFGSTILRAETAAIYGLSVLKAFRDQRS